MPDSAPIKPRDILPVKYRGIRYEVVEKPALRQLAPGSGFIMAIDDSNNEELWVLKVYESDMPLDIEDHKRNVNISKLKLKGLFSKTLLVVNERNFQFEVNLDSKEVKML